MRRWWVSLIVISTCFLAACQPVENAFSPTLDRTLPPPRVYRTVQPENTPVEEQLHPTPTIAATPGTLAEMARAVYGSRLIEFIQIPAIRVNAPVTPVGWHPSEDSEEQSEWDSPAAQVGWAVSSALPGDGENIILYGHNNIDSSVFKNLGKLQSGDLITLMTQAKSWEYQVQAVKIIPVSNPDEELRAYQEYFRPTGTSRLTLISCWPPTGNSFRVIVTANLVNEPRN